MSAAPHNSRVLLRHGLATALLFAACLPRLALAACEKTLRWDNDPPFSMQLPDGSIGGIYVDANREALKRLNCAVTLRKLPWARALKELELGRLDILPGAFRRPEREEYAYFSGKVLPASRNLLFVRQDAFERWPITRLIELRNLPFRLGAQINVHYGPDYEQLMSDPAYASRVAMVATRANLWNMIEKDRIDGAIADENTGTFEIQQLGLDDKIKASSVVVSSAAAEVAFSKGSNTPAFVEQYADALRALVEDGSYEQIVQRYVAR
ncbi:substrate-binding periplasmic protein [Halopseudomonas sabulinigri]|uniref:Transporter substrate-binding domain-containing protein n=1 Tax=Halopseudomonas sabulinigri TaxID=472181 RepID=A0ABP9ZJM2_9GAMM